MEPNPYESPKDGAQQAVEAEPTGQWRREHATLVLGCLGLSFPYWAWIMHQTPDRLPVTAEIVASIVGLLSLAAIAEGVWKLDNEGE